MEIYNTTTGKIIELSINDRKSNVEWTRDLIGNASELKYNDIEERYEMDQDNIEWWTNTIEGLENIDNLTEQAKELLSSEDFEELMQELYNEGNGSDYEQHITTLTGILNEVIKENLLC
jgi:hypothetical protein